LLGRSFLTWCNHICQLLLLFSELLESCSESHYLCLHLQMFFCPLFFPLAVLKFQVLHLGSMLNWILYRVRDRDLLSVLCMWIFSFLSTICWRGCPFFNICFWHVCWESGVCSCVGLFLGLYSIDLHLFLCQCHAVFVTMTL
jgi:hypothetical protein